MRMSVSSRLVSVGVVVCLLGVGGVASAKRTKLSVWFPLYGGSIKVGFDEMVSQFEKKYPDVQVEVLGVDVSGEKFLTAMAGGAPPDVIFPDGPQVVQWAYKNLLTPLDKYMASSKVNADNFWGPSYKQNLWKGKAYALPWITDSNAALVYNKAVFNETGLAKAPESLEELEVFAKKVTKTDAQGNYTRLGFTPWGGNTGGDFNAFYTETWAFGGEFYDEKVHKVQLNSPKGVAALEWMADYTQRYDFTKMGKFWEKYTNWNVPDGVITGRVGMGYRHSGFLGDLPKNKKTYTDFGYGFVVGPGGSKSAWMGGWTAAMPANARNKDAAWKFINFTCYGPGTTITYKTTGFLPALRTAECYADPEPKIRPFIEVLKIATHYRPVSPAMPVMNSELDRVMPLVFKGKKSPKQALDEATATAQRELDRMLAKRK